MKRLFENLPELYFIGFGTAWAMENLLLSSKINYIAMLFAWLIMLQLIYKNRFLGMAYSVLIVGLSVFKIIDISNSINASIVAEVSLTNVVFESLIVVLSMLVAVKMFIKYYGSQEKYADNELTISLKV